VSIRRHRDVATALDTVARARLITGHRFGSLSGRIAVDRQHSALLRETHRREERVVGTVAADAAL
jgi:hypothetical protein